jgi:hypothetical protein
MGEAALEPERERLTIEQARAHAAFEQKRLEIERERLEIERAKAQNEALFFNKHFGALATIFASVAAVGISGVISYVQIREADTAKEKDRLQKQQELTLTEREQNRRSKLDFAQFVSSHMNDLLADDQRKHAIIRDVMLATFPPEVAAVTFQQLALTVPDAVKTIWREGPKEAKSQVLSELLAPMVIQLERTKSAFNRWISKNLYLEAKIIRDGNLIIRDLLLRKAHLIPGDLRLDANRLVEHYDVWLEEFDRIRGDATPNLRGGTEPNLNEPFVFAGPKGYPFPVDSAERFKERFEQLQRELGTSAQRPNKAVVSHRRNRPIF